MCDLCYQKSQSNQITAVEKKTPVVDLPLGATEDRVVGSLNVERAIKEGIKALEPGILAAANRGILYIDEVNLLDDHVADVLLDAAAMGVNIVERRAYPLLIHPNSSWWAIILRRRDPAPALDRFGLQVTLWN